MGLIFLGNDVIAFDLAKKYNAYFIQIDSICGHLPPDIDEEYAKLINDLRGGM
jgi:hypothetical protein